MPPSRRLVRRQPLIDRIKAYLDPWDFLLWLSEELETSDWAQWQQTWVLPLGAAMNLVMLVARASTHSRTTAYDDVFGESSSAGLVTWMSSLVVYMLSCTSFANAFYTFGRKRHYRLFESAVEEQLTSPSAHRVKVQASPVASSPLRYLSRMIENASAPARAHPDPQRDVWELSIWDPVPLCLKLFCLFSPGHVLVYWVVLPCSPLDPHPSVTALTALLLATLLSGQLYLLQLNFSRQAKDTSLIHKEVLHEYDTKHVHPRTQRRMRDVGTQCSTSTQSLDAVEVYPTMTVVNKGFRTHANPNYEKHVNPEGVPETPIRLAKAHTSSVQHSHIRDFSSPLQPASSARQPHYRASTGGSGDGGSLGVYSHAKSPLKKSASTTFPANQALKRVQGSPIRRESGRF